MGILKHDEILKLYAAVVSAQLIPSRSALLVGIDGHFVGGLPEGPTASDQILEDLNAMSETGALADGSVPLAIWLANATARAGGKKEAAVFRDALARCGPATSEPLADVANASERSATQTPSGSTYNINIVANTVAAIAVGDASKAHGTVHLAAGTGDSPRPSDGTATALVAPRPTQFDDAWLDQQNATSAADLDTRYTPAHHVRTSSEELLDAVAVAESFIHQYKGLLSGVTEKARDLQHLCSSAALSESNVSIGRLLEAIAARLPNLGGGAKAPAMSSVQEACAEWQHVADEIWIALERLPSVDPSPSGTVPYSVVRERFSYERELLRRFLTKVEMLADFGTRFACADSRFVLVLGPAGSGKSHLLANLVQSSRARWQPALLLLGEYFLSAEEPWRQLSARVGWESEISDLLSALQLAAERAGRPALVCVDAVNESANRALWRTHLLAFASRFSKYPNLRLVISCRDDFASLTLPTRLAERREQSWAYVDHEGFGNNIFEAVASYFSGYGVRSLHFPPLLPEFQNPLFLRTFCEAFANSSLPDGPITLSVVMEARIARVCQKLLLDIDCPEDTTRRAITAIAELIRASGGQPVARGHLRSVIDALFPSHGESQSLYRHLRSNGLLVEIAHPASGVQSAVMVRFPFERFAEYFAADVMLRPYHTFKALKQAWTEDGTLARFERDSDRGLTSALAILVPERLGREFVALFPDGPAHSNTARWLSEFLASLAWRSPESFGEESQRVFLLAQQKNPVEALTTLLTVATIPKHPYNATFLHRYLKAMALPRRELAWTVPIGQGNRAALIIRWAFHVPSSLVSDEQAALVGRVLAWLCASNHRALRFRATLASIRLLANRGIIAAELVRDLHDANDPYVVERVFAVAAGVAMRDRNRDALRELAGAVFRALFGQEETPPNVLVRDFGRCVLEIAQQQDVMPPGIDPKRCRPPYRSEWPTIWSEEQVRAIEKAEGWHAIAASTQPESSAHYGDFGRYTMQLRVEYFAELPRSDTRKPRRGTKPFDAMTARRWVVQRVADLGWTPERFHSYERGLLHGRQRADVERWRTERIGKKYQWIALSELTGYLSDHYQLLPESGGGELPFMGAWQIGARDFDPSQPLRDLDDEQSDDAPRSTNALTPWWRERYPDPFADAALCADPSAWVRTPPADFRSLIEWQRVPDSEGEHVMLGGHCSWSERAPIDTLRARPGELHRWSDIRAWLVPRTHFAATLAAVRKIQFWGVGCDTAELGEKWLGQYPWGEEFADLRAFCGQPDRWVRDKMMPIEQTIVGYMDGFVPAPRLLALLDAQWTGEELDFRSADGKRVAFSPLAQSGAHGAPLLTRKADLVSALHSAGWDIIWAITGDQTCFDHKRSVHVANAEMKFSAVYWLEGDTLAGGLTRTDIVDIP